MKNFYKILPFSFLFLFYSFAFSGEIKDITVPDAAVKIKAEVVVEPKGIKLTWDLNTPASSYIISKKNEMDQSWGSPIANLDSLSNSFIDTAVTEGNNYEYEIMALSIGMHSGVVDANKQKVPFNYLAFGYVFVGYNSLPIHNFGKCLILVDETMNDALNEELIRLENDLVSEGWSILRKTVPRAEIFDTSGVRIVKSLIKYERSKDNSITTLFLIGRIPVPYSGNLNPDGHPDHQGAWPCDLYYGCTNENEFRDLTVSNTVSTREQNKNIPKDGKFDISAISMNNVSLQIGRVDFYDMPEFKTTETELLRAYLNKDHKYRTNQVNIKYNAIIDDNFTTYTLELFGQNGWRNFPPLVGSQNVKASDFFTALGTENSLFSYGCGGGYYNSCAGVGVTADFTTKPVNGIFTMLFGSYFGDWDSQNNILRAPLASQPNVLTCAWAARPSWYLHHMALGYPMGYSAKLAMNNSSLYKPIAYYFSSNPTLYVAGTKGVHIALMGDPTLTMFNEYINPPKSISAVQKTDLTKEITWESSDTQGKLFYYVYKSTKREGPYEVISDKIDGNKFSDTVTYEGRVYYMVRAAKLISNYSGSTYRLSPGLATTILVTGIEEQPQSKFSINPNPAKDNINIEFFAEKPGTTKIDLLSLEGIKITELFNSEISNGDQKLSFNIANLNLTQGTYFLRLSTGDLNKLEKVIIIK